MWETNFFKVISDHNYWLGFLHEVSNQKLSVSVNHLTEKLLKMFLASKSAGPKFQIVLFIQFYFDVQTRISS